MWIGANPREICSKQTGLKVIEVCCRAPLRTIDQSNAPEGEKAFRARGRYHFVAGKTTTTTSQVSGVKGIVHIDALQLIEVK